MIARTLAAATVLAILAAPALADQCETLMAQFDVDIVINAEGHEEVKLKEARELRARGEALHEIGEHEDAQKRLRSAANILTECRC